MTCGNIMPVDKQPRSSKACTHNAKCSLFVQAWMPPLQWTYPHGPLHTCKLLYRHYALIPLAIYPVLVGFLILHSQFFFFFKSYCVLYDDVMARTNGELLSQGLDLVLTLGDFTAVSPDSTYQFSSLTSLCRIDWAKCLRLVVCLYSALFNILRGAC